jgi:hypothetical protein
VAVVAHITRGRSCSQGGCVVDSGAVAVQCENARVRGGATNARARWTLDTITVRALEFAGDNCSTWAGEGGGLAVAAAL